jgi:hypothetical protein
MTRAAVAGLATTAIASAALPASALAGITLSVTTASTQQVSATTATLQAKVSVSVLGAAVTWQYGPTTAYGLTSGPVSTSLLAINQTLSSAVTGLSPGTTYHVRAIAASGLALIYGNDDTFTTAPVHSGSSGPGSGSSGSGSSGSGSSGSGSGSSGSGSSGSGSSGSGSSGSGSSGSGSGSSGPSSGSPKDDAQTPGSDTEANTGSGAGASRGSSPDATTDDSRHDASTDGGATAAPGVATAAITPVLGQTVGVAAVHGAVVATTPSGSAIDLRAAHTVPTGTVIDARAGTVELKTALDRRGATQTGRFWGGRFTVLQSATTRGLTQLVLRGGDFSGCPADSAQIHGHAAAKKKRTPSRTLWGSDSHGRFQTSGRGSVATVRGTRWSTTDTCAGTLTTVTAGAVAVHDLRRNRTVTVSHGRHNRYLARVAS